MTNYGKDIKKLSDNVINVANVSGYDTYWYSTQGGAQGITAIASFAKEKKWMSGYDQILLPYLKETVNKPSKKLIVLHINGSHPYACDKYPQTETFWKGGIDECYDNSIRYTDKIIGDIFDILKDKNAAFVYLADHGQIKIGGNYQHGDYKEAVQIPFFVWYPNTVKPFKSEYIREIKEVTSSTVLYSKVLELMGTYNPKTVDNSGKYLKLDLTTENYNNLK